MGMNVSLKATSLIKAFIVCLGAFAAAPVNAQGSVAPTWSDAVSQHHQLQYRMMNEMTQQMAGMTEQMSRTDLSPAESKKMGEQMSRMAKMMHFMSGLAARPAHTHGQLERQMDQMRAQMVEMQANSLMTPAAR